MAERTNLQDVQPEHSSRAVNPQRESSTSTDDQKHINVQDDGREPLLQAMPSSTFNHIDPKYMCCCGCMHMRTGNDMETVTTNSPIQNCQLRSNQNEGISYSDGNLNLNVHSSSISSKHGFKSIVNENKSYRGQHSGQFNDYSSNDMYEEKRSCSSATSSTLSLHIAAYETDAHGNELLNAHRNEILNDVKQCFVNLEIGGFEYPRQQDEDDQRKKPAMVQYTTRFKAPQKIAAPQEKSKVNAETQGFLDVVAGLSLCTYDSIGMPSTHDNGTSLEKYMKLSINHVTSAVLYYSRTVRVESHEEGLIICVVPFSQPLEGGNNNLHYISYDFPVNFLHLLLDSPARPIKFVIEHYPLEDNGIAALDFFIYREKFSDNRTNLVLKTEWIPIAVINYFKTGCRFHELQFIDIIEYFPLLELKADFYSVSSSSFIRHLTEYDPVMHPCLLVSFLEIECNVETVNVMWRQEDFTKAEIIRISTLLGAAFPFLYDLSANFMVNEKRHISGLRYYNEMLKLAPQQFKDCFKEQSKVIVNFRVMHKMAKGFDHIPLKTPDTKFIQITREKPGYGAITCKLKVHSDVCINYVYRCEPL